MLNFLLRSAGEKVANHYIQLDSAISEKLEKIANKVIKFEIVSSSIEGYICIAHDHFDFKNDYDQPVDAVIRASSLAILKQGFRRLWHKTSLDQEIEITGDLHVVHQFLDVLEHVEIDWEEQLSRVFGDFLAYPIATVIKGVLHKAQEIKDTLLLNTKEYLQEEQPLVASPLEAQTFLNEVDHVRDGTERLQCRVKRLEEKLL